MPIADTNELQAVLADFANRARRVSTEGTHELWRFCVDSFVYDLHWWPQANAAMAKYVGGSAAARMFVTLQALQKARIPARRVVANLRGFVIEGRKGDACIAVHDPLVRPLRDVIGDRSVPPNLLLAHMTQRLVELQQNRLCPTPLDLDCFAWREGDILIDCPTRPHASDVTRERLFELGRSALRHATRTQRLRVWRHFKEQSEPPPALRRLFAGVRKTEMPPTTPVEVDGWRGRFLSRAPWPLPWSRASSVEFTEQFWRGRLPRLIDQTGNEVLKSDASGRVVAATLSHGQIALDVVLKQARFKPGLRGLSQRLRRSRARRMWDVAWRLLERGIDCEVPLLLLEQREGARLVDQLIAFERVPGEVLSKFDLQTLDARRRALLMRRCGKVIERIESLGWSHFDTKTSNWIITTDAAGDPRPVLIDLYGIRFYPWRGFALKRLLRALRELPGFTANDEAALRAGYAFH